MQNLFGVALKHFLRCNICFSNRSQQPTGYKDLEAAVGHRCVAQHSGRANMKQAARHCRARCARRRGERHADK